MSISNKHVTNSECTVEVITKEVKEEMFKNHIKFNGDIKVLDSINTFFNPRLKVGENIIALSYFEQAKRINDALGFDSSEPRFHVHKSDINTIVLIEFYNIFFMIAPRVDDAISEDGGNKE